MSSDDTFFIPCEICDEPIINSDYYSHVSSCNSRQILRNITSQYAINPLFNLFNMDQQVSTSNISLGSPSTISSMIIQPPAQLITNDEEDETGDEENDLPQLIRQPGENLEEEFEIPELPYTSSNLAIRLLSSFLANYGGELQVPDVNQNYGRFRNMFDLIPTVYEIFDRPMEFEDVVVGLTPVQKAKCLIQKEFGTTESLCEICYEEEPPKIITELICGHKMCKKCADKHFAEHVKCPFCNQDLRDILEAKEKSKKEKETENIAG